MALKHASANGFGFSRIHWFWWIQARLNLWRGCWCWQGFGGVSWAHHASIASILADRKRQRRCTMSAAKMSALLKVIAVAASSVPTGGKLTDEGRIALVLAALHRFGERFLDAPDAEGRARLQEVLRVLGEP
jgi:hypothetical protein